MKRSIIAVAFAVVAMTMPTLVFANHSEAVEMADVPTRHECALTKNLGFGMKGPDVVCLQEHLIESGHLPSGTQKGYFGARTKAALILWQRSAGIHASGYFGPISRAVLSGVAGEEAVHAEEAADAHSTSTSSTDVHHASHAPINVEQWSAAPSVAIVVHKDAMSGYNLEIKVENFRFAPEHASGAVIPNEGHAHLMVNGKKLARVYGNWFHIPVETLTVAGSNEVLITLNANDHSDLTIGGVRVQATSTIQL